MEEEVSLDVSEIRYTQDTIRDVFTNGRPLTVTLAKLTSGEITVDQIPKIKVPSIVSFFRVFSSSSLLSLILRFPSLVCVFVLFFVLFCFLSVASFVFLVPFLVRFFDFFVSFFVLFLSPVIFSHVL